MLMVYYHISTSLKYLEDLEVIPSVGKVRADGHGGDANNSAHCFGYSSPSNVIVYGDGGVDGAEDADIILHELGHFIQEKSSGGKYGGNTKFPSAYPEMQAMAEGFADYWAFSNNVNLADKANAREACVADWWIKGEGGGDCGARRLNMTAARDGDFGYYPNEMTSRDYHINGQIWASTLRDLFLRLGKDTTDKLVLRSHRLVPNNPTFCDGQKALVKADKMLNKGVNRPAIASVMRQRGIASDLVAEVKPAPGDPNTGMVVVTNKGHCGSGPVTIKAIIGKQKGPPDVRSETIGDLRIGQYDPSKSYPCNLNSTLRVIIDGALNQVPPPLPNQQPIGEEIELDEHNVAEAACPQG